MVGVCVRRLCRLSPPVEIECRKLKHDLAVTGVHFGQPGHIQGS